ncbi:MAG: hypothetical protein WA081_19260 [Desulfosalsimonadaceae bacterium]
MNKIIMMITVILFIAGCSHQIQPGCSENVGLDHRFGHSEPQLLGSGAVPVAYACGSDWNFGRNDDQGQNVEKINARVLVYIPENFKYYQNDNPTAIQTISYKFSQKLAYRL